MENHRHLLLQYVTSMMLSIGKYDQFQKTLQFTKYRISDKLYQKAQKSGVAAFKSTTSRLLDVKQYSFKKLLLVPENAYDLFYQEVIDNDFVKGMLPKYKQY